MSKYVPVDADVQLWADDTETPGTPILLIMGANASAATWPPELIAGLAARHRVIRYDHRDTGKSSAAFDARPYPIRRLADDAVTVLDAFEIDRAHVVGMSMGGVLTQLLLLDHPERLRSATVFCTAALGAGLAAEDPTQSPLPGPDPRLWELWQEMGTPRDREAELAWQVEHWRLLNGDQLPFDDAEFRALVERVFDHDGDHRSPAAHARAAQDGLERGAELAATTVPTLVLDAPADPINPPPHGPHLAATVGGARMTTIPGMGHALNSAVVPTLVEEILAHAAAHDD